MPQKHPPASTAVSSPGLCAGASAAGGGMLTAGSACAANGAAVRASARRADRSIMAGILMGCLLSYTSEAARKHHTMLHVGVRGTSSLRRANDAIGSAALYSARHLPPETGDVSWPPTCC